MDVSKFVMIFISMVFINNFILSKFLGLCPFIGVSKETRPAISMGAAVTFVMTMSSVITWLIYRYLLIPFNMTYMRTLSFILVIAASVQLVEMFIRKFSPALYRTLGIYLPLITTNCAVLGVAVLNSEQFFADNKSVAGSFPMAITQGFCAGVGFCLAILLMSGIRERLELSSVPRCMKEVPLAFIIASLMSLSFMGFAGFRF
jgi:electron transport complex protein RnfA